MAKHTASLLSAWDLRDMKKNVSVIVVFAVLLFIGYFFFDGTSSFSEPDRSPDIRGIVDEWVVRGNVAQASVEVDRGRYQQMAFILNANTKIGKGSAVDRTKEKNDRKVAEGSIFDIRDHTFVDIYYNDSGEKEVDTLIYWQ